MLSPVKTRRIVGAVLAAGGGAAIGHAIEGMGRVGNCGYPGMPVCPSSVGNDMYLMAAGVVILAVGSVLTWGVGILFGLLGAGVTGIAHGSVTLAAACLAPLGLILLVGAVTWRRAQARIRARADAAQRADAAERLFTESATMTVGKVTALADTGTTINDNPVATITVSYTRDDGRPATVQTTQMLPRLAIPRPGDRATVWYDPVSGKAAAEVTSARADVARRDPD
jgi:type II secretory pathway pseudopilin PulG